jgi:citrate synthase
LQVPSKDQASAVTQELQQRSTLPEHLKKVLKSLPKDRHPMTQLSIAILALQVGISLITSFGSHA